MIWNEQIGDELYVYYNGELIYKRWISKEYGFTFQNYKKLGEINDRRFFLIQKKNREGLSEIESKEFNELQKFVYEAYPRQLNNS